VCRARPLQAHRAVRQAVPAEAAVAADTNKSSRRGYSVFESGL
jgi:hypothetical protein